MCPAASTSQLYIPSYQSTNAACCDQKSCVQKVLVLAQVTEEEVVQSLRKQSRGAQRTSSQYRGVTKHQKGKWEARIGQMVGRKYK